MLSINQALAQKMQRMYIAPENMYRDKPDLYSQFDINGIPTHDAAGKELSKSTMKKLQKDWEKQKKLYDSR
jgi:cysteinyl-tRNA synthetase